MILRKHAANCHLLFIEKSFREHERSKTSRVAAILKTYQFGIQENISLLNQQQFLDLMNQLVTGSYLKQQGQLLMLQEYVPPKLDCRYLCFLSEHHLHKKPTYTMEVVVSQFSHKY